jgi:hypothetical protein
MQWYRIALDEAQNIRNRTTRALIFMFMPWLSLTSSQEHLVPPTN